jgi:hypothetical protein
VGRNRVRAIVGMRTRIQATSAAGSISLAISRVFLFYFSRLWVMRTKPQKFVSLGLWMPLPRQ